MSSILITHRVILSNAVRRNLVSRPALPFLIYQRQFHSVGGPLLQVGKKTTKPVEKKSTTTVTEPAKKTIWETVKHEVNHYWEGTKLLGFEIKVSFKLALKSAAGYELTRRENKQLQRTTQDIVRLVPFSMFVIVPFAELLLPVALKMFPNLLPSTYESSADKEKKRSKLLKTRTSVSQLLKDSIQMKFPSALTEEQKADFKDFLVKIRSSSEQPSREQLLRVAKLFKDDTVLDNLQRSQLVAVAKYINLQPIGTNQMLTFRIRNKLLNIKRDDKAIYYEGIDSLSTVELQAACSSRGIRVSGVPVSELKRDLTAWLNLRLNERIPSTLLVLSNAYTYGDLDSDETIYDALQAVLSSMPEEVYHVAEADVVEEVSNKQRLELLKEQQELIESETKQDTDDGIIIQVQDKKNLDDDEVHESKESTEASSEKAGEPKDSKKD